MGGAPDPRLGCWHLPEVALEAVQLQNAGSSFSVSRRGGGRQRRLCGSGGPPQSASYWKTGLLGKLEATEVLPPAPPQWQERTLPPPPGEKPYLCDKCGRGFNRVDNLRSHVKTVHQGKAGIKILEPEEGGEVSVVTVDDMVTLATEALAATAVTQLTGGGRHSPPGSRGWLQEGLPLGGRGAGDFDFRPCDSAHSGARGGRRDRR